MKHVKLYEGFISEFLGKAKILKDEYRKSIEECLQILLDEYGLEYKTIYRIEYDICDFKYKITNCTLTPGLVDAIINADRKLRQNGSCIAFEAFAYRLDDGHHSPNSVYALEDFVKFAEKLKGSEVIIPELPINIKDVKS